MTLPTRPIEDVVADLQDYASSEPLWRVDNRRVMEEAADLLLSQAREAEMYREEIARLRECLNATSANARAKGKTARDRASRAEVLNKENKALQQRLEAVEGRAQQFAFILRGKISRGEEIGHEDIMRVLQMVTDGSSPITDEDRRWACDAALSAIQPVGGE